MMRLTFDGLFGGFVLDLAAVREQVLASSSSLQSSLSCAVLDAQFEQVVQILRVQLAGVDRRACAAG